MTSEELLERLKRAYSQSFDVTSSYTIGEDTYDAYGEFNVTSAKYVLTKKAELWRAQCYEHAFFKRLQTLDQGELDGFMKQIENYMEPELVRHGEKYPPPNHMYTFLTGIFIVDRQVSPEVMQAVKKFKYVKNYRFTIRGYCEARLVVFDMEQKKVFGNAAAKDIVKGYKKIF